MCGNHNRGEEQADWGGKLGDKEKSSKRYGNSWTKQRIAEMTAKPQRSLVLCQRLAWGKYYSKPRVRLLGDKRRTITHVHNPTNTDRGKTASRFTESLTLPAPFSKTSSPTHMVAKQKARPASTDGTSTRKARKWAEAAAAGVGMGK